MLRQVASAFDLFAIDETAEYLFTDADDSSEFKLSGAELVKQGFAITIKEKRTAKLYFYKKL